MLQDAGRDPVIFVKEISMRWRFVRLLQELGNDHTINLLAPRHHIFIISNEVSDDRDAGIVPENPFILNSISLMFAEASSVGSDPVK